MIMCAVCGLRIRVTERVIPSLEWVETQQGESASIHDPQWIHAYHLVILWDHAEALA